METTDPNNEASEKNAGVIADEHGVALVFVDENGIVSESNNNSICRHLEPSEEFGPRCAEFCGRAFGMANSAGGNFRYECHAGLECVAVPLGGPRKLVAIVGRTFTRAENYRRATERAISGDWNEFPPSAFFDNILITGNASGIDAAVRETERLQAHGTEGANSVAKPSEITTRTDERELAGTPETDDQAGVPESATEENPAPEENIATPVQTMRAAEENDEIGAWRSLFGSLFGMTYREACLSIMQFLSQRYKLVSVAWLERRENRFESLLATGSLDGQQFKINIPADDKLLFDALESELSLELRERARNGERSAGQTISLFPVSVGGEVQCALVVADLLDNDVLKRRISRFCKTVASELEILRLREEVKRRNRLANAVEKFNASIKNPDSEDFWMNLTRVSAELMKAERGSLLIFDEKDNSLTVKAAVGLTADRIKEVSASVGDRVARVVLQKGKPVVVSDVSKIGLPAAPADWKYKSNSFISYPFSVGGRKVGILNVTDKADGLAYGEADLELLNAIAPQVAVLIDRATLQNRAGELEQLSVTDALTGLLNRRYLEERLAEEIKRSNRYGYPMSFMMIDVDHFKSYNDEFLHTEGDKALKIVGKCLRDTLRSADVAARYGGEEFSILLPQTTSSEAATIAERLRENIAATEFPNRQITVSIGIASCGIDLNSPSQLIEAADHALYEAKHRGRNNVQVYENLRDAED